MGNLISPNPEDLLCKTRVIIPTLHGVVMMALLFSFWGVGVEGDDGIADTHKAQTNTLELLCELAECTLSYNLSSSAFEKTFLTRQWWYIFIYMLSHNPYAQLREPNLRMSNHLPYGSCRVLPLETSEPMDSFLPRTPFFLLGLGVCQNPSHSASSWVFSQFPRRTSSAHRKPSFPPPSLKDSAHQPLEDSLIPAGPPHLC